MVINLDDILILQNYNQNMDTTKKQFKILTYDR